MKTSKNHRPTTPNIPQESELSKIEAPQEPPTLEENRKITNSINEVLEKHNIKPIPDGDLIIGTDAILNYTTPGKPIFSDSVINHIFNPEKSGKFYHYTTKEKTEKILSTKTLRLYSLEKRIDEHEMTSFAEDHNLRGLLDNPELKKELSSQFFYASFTKDKNNEDYFWRTFSESDGHRILFSIKPKESKLFSIIYGHRGIKLLNDLYEAAKLHNKKLYITGLSRFFALYLPAKHYERENEIRLLHYTPPRPEDDDSDYDQNHGVKKDENGHRYIEIEIGKESGEIAHIEIESYEGAQEVTTESKNYTFILRNRQ